MKSRLNSSSKAATPRQLKVGEEIRHVIAALFERGEVLDALGKTVSATVTEVRISPDLKQATAFVLPLGVTVGGGKATNPEELLQTLKQAKGFIRHAVTKAVVLKFSPDLQFKLDTTLLEASRIHALLQKPEVARDLRPITDEA
jgi:ribosome-binding factor A